LKSAPLGSTESTRSRLRSRTVPWLTNPAGKVPFQVMMSNTPLLVSIPPTISAAAPVSRNMPLLTRLLLTTSWPVSLTLLVQPAATSSLSAILSQPLVMFRVALLVRRRMPACWPTASTIAVALLMMAVSYRLGCQGEEVMTLPAPEIFTASPVTRQLKITA